MKTNGVLREGRKGGKVISFVFLRVRRATSFVSLKVVNGDFFHEGLDELRNEFQVLWMHLIIILRLLARENGAERDLVSLIHDRPRAADHFADMKLRQAGNVLEKFFAAGNDGVRCFGFCRVGPENDDMAELRVGLCYG